MQTITAATLKAWINDGQELAILDAREDGEFGRSHLFWANPCGLSKAEIRARQILPRLSVRICCVDAGEDGLAGRLAAVLRTLGCTDVHVLEGGNQAWAAAGYVLFSGVNVPSKAFGEWVEHHYHTPSVDPEELKAMMDAGTDMVVLDSRPMDEFHRMSIPTGVDVPGGELVYRIGDLVPNPATTIVVNCAGRTRSIMGAESLRSAGVPNKVVALRNGTMGWELAGFSCDRGSNASYPRGVPASLETALQRATAFADKHGVKTLPAAALPELMAEKGRTTHLLDVRDPEEFRAGHIPGSRSAPGGQLVQGSDGWVAVRHARLVLVCDTGVRSRMTGGWLRQLGGWEVFVLEGGLQGASLAHGMPPVECPEARLVEADPIPPAAVAAALESHTDVAVVDLARSVDFRAGHIPGALWGVRTRLAKLLPQLQGKALVVVAAPDLTLAKLAVPELQALLPKAQVRPLAGGMATWKADGLPLEADRRNPADADCIDFYLRPYDRNDGIEEAMREYLSWEIDLVHEVARDGDARFGEG